MAATALIKITQGVTTDLAGRALVGATGASVVFSNGDDTDVLLWTYELLEVPPGSTLVPVTQGPNATPSFTMDPPDVPGSYRVRLTVSGSSNVDRDIRNFVVPFPNRGFLTAPYQGLPQPLPLTGPGAKPEEMNVGGQARGWMGDNDPSRPLIHQLIAFVDSIEVPTITINSFGVSPSLVEVSQSVVTPAFTATYSQVPTTVILTDNDGSSPKDVSGTPNSFASNGTFTKNAFGGSVTFTNTATNSSGTDTSNTTITWGQKNWFGLGVIGGSTEAFIEALSGSFLSTSRNASFTLVADGTHYQYYATRAAYGAPTFKDHSTGFAVDMTLISTTINVTNAHGFAENYQLWRTTNPGQSLTIDVT